MVNIELKETVQLTTRDVKHGWWFVITETLDLRRGGVYYCWQDFPERKFLHFRSYDAYGVDGVPSETPLKEYKIRRVDVVINVKEKE